METIQPEIPKDVQELLNKLNRKASDEDNELLLKQLTEEIYAKLKELGSDAAPPVGTNGVPVAHAIEVAWRFAEANVQNPETRRALGYTELLSLLVEAREQLTEYLLKSPGMFSAPYLDSLMLLMDTDDLLTVSRRIFDLNEGSITNRADAKSGMLGYFNQKSRRRRSKQYFRKVRRELRKKRFEQGNETGYTTILCEGDSWFEFPIWVRDVVDWLKKNNKFAVKSLAYGGDWLANILYEGEYIEELPVNYPEVFIISGGGNDLVGSHRLAMMINNKGLPQKSGLSEKDREDKLAGLHQQYQQYVEKAPPGNVHYGMLKGGSGVNGDKAEIIAGISLLSEDFFAFINLMHIQYRLMFANIRHKYPNLHIITQGYDYAIPSASRKWSSIAQLILNIVMDNGKWLHDPLKIKGVNDKNTQRLAIKAMIYIFNQMLIQVAEKVENVTHIDCRGICEEKDWFDELHPKSRIFKKIAAVYRQAIEDFQKGEKIQVYHVHSGAKATTT